MSSQTVCVVVCVNVLDYCHPKCWTTSQWFSSPWLHGAFPSWRNLYTEKPLTLTYAPETNFMSKFTSKATFLIANISAALLRKCPKLTQLHWFWCYSCSQDPRVRSTSPMFWHFLAFGQLLSTRSMEITKVLYPLFVTKKNYEVISMCFI